MRFTASKASLLRSCRFPFRDGTPCVETRGKAAIEGDEFHKRIAAVVDPACVAPEKPVTTKWMRERLVHAMVWLDENRVEGWRAEEAFVYAPQTGVGRPLGYNIDRQYDAAGMRSDEIGGSADISHLEGDCAVTWDWKTGRFISESTWAQMDTIALMSARARGAWSARATILHVTAEGVTATTREYDDIALWNIAQQLQRDLAEVPDAWPEVSEACDLAFCPAREGCASYQMVKKENAA